MDYHIRNAADNDLPRISDIYAYARRFMAEHNNPHQWGLTKPSLNDLKDDIRLGNLYVVESSDRICGVFAFIIGPDPTYKMIYDGNWNYEHPYGTIHRIAGDGSGGILQTCVNYCQQRIPYLRIDTHEDNYVMQNAIAKAGFSRCGIIYIADGTPRIAYDRRI